MKQFLLLVLLTLPLTSAPQNLEEARIEGQPLVYMKEGRPDGCGIRLISTKPDPIGSAGTAWDVSVSFWRSGLAAAKGLSYNFDVRTMQAGGKPKAANLTGFWLRAPGTQATLPRDKKMFPGQDTGSLMYAITMDAALDIFKAVVDKQKLTVGIRRAEDATERLYFGNVLLTDAEMMQLLECLTEVGR